MTDMTDACGQAARHQCGISLRNVCDGCMLNPATDTSDVPKKVYTWTFNDLPRYIRDTYGERVHCSDYEKAKKGTGGGR